MELNGITLIGYTTLGNTASFTLDCDFEEALALDGQELKVTDGESEKAVFGGYRLTGLQEADGYTRASFAMALEPNTEQAISALRQNLAIANTHITQADTKATDAQSTASSAESQVSDLSAQLDAYGEAIEELATQVLSN